MLRSFSYESAVLAVLFVFSLALAVLAFMVCLFFLARAWHSGEYEYLPLAGSLEQSLNDFEAYYEGEPGRGAEEFTARLRRSIIEAADTNTVLNDRRSRFLYLARVALFALLVFWALGGATYIADQVSNGMTTPSNQNQPSPSQTSNEQTDENRPQAPRFPPNRLIREGRAPTEKGEIAVRRVEKTG
jgi:hypothetical protein